MYLLTNQITGEQYVGQTIKTVARRWYAHCISAQSPKFPVAVSIATYGKDNFTVQELFAAFDKQSLNWAEQVSIADLQPTLNRTRGGAGTPRQLTPEECAKRSDAAKRRWANPEWKAKTVASLKNAVRKAVPYEVLRARGEQTCAKRWAGHVKPTKQFVGTGALTAKTWQDPVIRQKRIDGLRAAFAKPEVKEKRRVASVGRKMPVEAIENSARAKWKPVYCQELEVSFLNQKYAAEYLGALKSSVCAAIKNKGKVNKQFTLVRVA